VLASLPPALVIADRCTLDDRFLIVRGNLRTYKSISAAATARWSRTASTCA
jgi:hypothetical protein